MRESMSGREGACSLAGLTCPLAKLLSRNVYFGRERLYDHGHAAPGVLARTWDNMKPLVDVGVAGHCRPVVLLTKFGDVEGDDIVFFAPVQR